MYHQSNLHSRGGGGGGGAGSSSSSGSELPAGIPISSDIQRFKSANRHRFEQNGMSGGIGSAANFFPQVGHVKVGDLELIGETEYPMD